MSDDTLREGAGEPDKLSPEKRQELHRQVLTRYEQGVGEFEENRRMFSEDLRFAFDSEGQGQWAPETLSARQGRPSYTFNRVLMPINLIVADQRQNHAEAKFRPANGDASPEVAEVFDGLWRAMERDSRANAVYDTQFKYAVAGGFGEVRMIPEYVAPDSFDQALFIRDVPNPLTVVRDPESCDPCGADAQWCIVADRISIDKYTALYPKGAEQSFTMSRDSYGWFTDKQVRIAEYWERIPVKKTIALLSDGRVIDFDRDQKAIEAQLEETPDQAAATVVNTRDVLEWRVRWVKCDGAEILEGPITYKWQRIPIVRIPGRYVNIEGRKKFQSAIRHSKDPQRAYNFRRSDMIERSSLVPKAPYLVTGKMINGYEDIWNNANVSPRPYLPYNPDKDAPDAKPVREAPIDLPEAAIAMAQQDAQDIQATTGFFDPALGNADDMNRVSGKALVQHTRRSDLGSYEFVDGFGKALQLLAEMFADMIPTVMDAERVVAIVGKDTTEKLVGVNMQHGGDVINDLKKGRYGVTVTLGPSYQTARQEAMATLMEAAEKVPGLAAVAGDIIAKNIDSPDADEISRRMRIPLIKAGIIQPTPAEQKAMQGQPQQPNPLQQAEIAEKQANAQSAQARAVVEASKAHAASIEQHRLIAETAGKHLDNLKTAKELGQESLAATAEAQAAQ